MLSRMHNKFGTAGLVVAVVALVAALTGAAFAAGGLTKQQEKQVKKIAKKYAGKRGPAGPQGPAGAQGSQGAKGDKGDPGANGANGTNGVSPVGTSFNGAQGGCTEGGVKFVGANTTYACNGAEGQTGFTATLPPGETETGTFAVGFTAAGGLQLAPISYNIPLTDPATINVVNATETEWFDPNLGPQAGTSPNCPGTADEPEAEPGFLCVYADEEFNLEGPGYEPWNSKSYVSGAVLYVRLKAEGKAAGTWAVTAPTA
jgi:hypothetical protein